MSMPVSALDLYKHLTSIRYDGHRGILYVVGKPPPPDKLDKKVDGGRAPCFMYYATTHGKRSRYIDYYMFSCPHNISEEVCSLMR